MLFPAAVYVVSDDQSSVIDRVSIRQRRTRKIEAAVGVVDQHESVFPSRTGGASIEQLALVDPDHLAAAIDFS